MKNNEKKAEAPAKAEVKREAPARKESSADEALEAPSSRKDLDAMVKKHGADKAIETLSKVRVVDLRTLAREYNGEFGIAGREITLANKKALIEEFRKFFNK